MVIILKSGRGVVVFNVRSDVEKNSATCTYKVVWKNAVILRRKCRAYNNSCPYEPLCLAAEMYGLKLTDAQNRRGK